jgi:hypothetical protein
MWAGVSRSQNPKSSYSSLRRAAIQFTSKRQSIKIKVSHCYPFSLGHLILLLSLLLTLIMDTNNNDDQQRKPPAKKQIKKPRRKLTSDSDSSEDDNDEILAHDGTREIEDLSEPFPPTGSVAGPTGNIAEGWASMNLPPLPQQMPPVPMPPMGFQNAMLNQAHPYAVHHAAANRLAVAQFQRRPASAPPHNPVTQYQLESDSDSESESELGTSNKTTKKKPVKKKPAKKKPTKKAKAEEAKRKANFSREELSDLLDIIEERLPIGANEWESVANFHEEAWPGRDWKNLKKKFQLLNRKKMPTGDPNCPPEVIRAKRITARIMARSNCQNFNESDDDEDDTLNDGIVAADDGDPEEETPITKKKTSWGSKRKDAPAQLVHSSGSRRRSAAGGSESAMESYIRLQQLQSELRSEERQGSLSIKTILDRLDDGFSSYTTES